MLEPASSLVLRPITHLLQGGDQTPDPSLPGHSWYLVIDVLPGMKVKHALIRAGLLDEVASAKKVPDEWENELGLGGALGEGLKIFVG